MKSIYAGSLFAVMCFGAGGVASAQGSCEQSIQQLRQQLGQEQIDQQLRQSIEQLLTSAENNPSNCERIVTSARTQLQATGAQQGQQQAGEPEVERRAETNAQAVRRAETSARAERDAHLARQAAADDAELDIVGNNVINRDGDEIGEISGLARSRANDQVYALVDVGGFFGIGERTVAIPVDQARTDEDGNLVTPYTREQLEQMPEYDPQQYSTN